MLDISWSELLIVLIIAVFAIGPKQLPDLLYQAGRMIRRLQYMRFALTRQMDDFMMQGDIRELEKTAPVTRTDKKPEEEPETDEAEMDLDPDYLPPEREIETASETPESAEAPEKDSKA